MTEFSKYLEVAKEAARKASEEILSVYNSSYFNVELKGDNSPLTQADRISHQIIKETLASTQLPLLSEEGRDFPYEERKNWDLFWMVDPIDGTKEFIKRNGEFTVNIALISKCEPVLGVVLVPATGDLYEATKGGGAFKNGSKIAVNTCSFSESNLRVVASRSHLNEETEVFISQLNDPVIVSKGSSLKLLMVAEGEADIYPRFAPTMEWDTAAAQAVVVEAGGKVLVKDSNMPVEYNKENLLNPYFLVKGNLLR